MRTVIARRSHLFVLVGYGLLAVLLTWPTVAHLATHLPGDGGDDPAIAWNLWWVKHALLNLHTNPLHTDYLFYPIGVNLAFYTLTVLNALTVLPLTLNLGVVTASNFHMLLTFVIGGYGAFLLARQQLAAFQSKAATWTTEWAAILAGGFYAFASSKIFYLALGQFNIASSHWIPYVLLFVFKARDDARSLRWPALAALFLVMQAWAEMTYASFVLIFIALYVAYEAISWQISNIKYQTSNPKSSTVDPRPDILLPLRNLSVLAVLFTIGISPLLGAMLPDMRAAGDFWVQGSGFAESFSADLAGFLVPTMHHPLLGQLVSSTGITAFDKGQHIYLGLTLLALAAIGATIGLAAAPRGRCRSQVGFWLLSTILFAWLSLGPTIRVNGADTGIPGPFVFLQSLPFIKGNRYPSRFSVMLLLSLAMLAAGGIHAILDRAARRPAVSGRAESAPRPRGTPPAMGIAVAVLVFGLFLFEHLAIPLPQSDMTVPSPYHAVAKEPEGGALLDIPVAWRNGFRITGPIDPGFMFGQFYQTVHGRPLLQGNTSRNPEFKFQYFTEAPVINSILALETGHQLPPGRLESDRAVAGDVLRFFGIRTIVVRQANGANPQVAPEATLPYIEAVMPVEQVYDDPTLTMYRVDLPPLPELVRIDATAPLARLHLGEGWGAIADRQTGAGEPLMWAQRQTVRLFVALDGQSQQMAGRIFVPGDGQRLVVRVDGWRSDPVSLNRGWGEYRLALPSQAIRPGLNEIRLDFDRLYPVTGLPVVDDSPSAVTVLVQSAGQEVGDLGHIYVNGVDVSPNQRGYNVAVIGPEGSIHAAAFDTHVDPNASTTMAQFVTAVPPGWIVAVAAADEASMNLGEEGVAALRSIGASGDLRERFRWSHAIIGIKGKVPGTALEAMDGLRPVALASGPAVSQPTVAAAVGWLQFEVERAGE